MKFFFPSPLRTSLFLTCVGLLEKKSTLLHFSHFCTLEKCFEFLGFVSFRGRGEVGRRWASRCQLSQISFTLRPPCCLEVSHVIARRAVISGRVWTKTLPKSVKGKTNMHTSVCRFTYSAAIVRLCVGVSQSGTAVFHPEVRCFFFLNCFCYVFILFVCLFF